MVKNKRLEKEQITTASIKKLISVLQSGTINYEQYQQELQMQLDKMSEANKAICLNMLLIEKLSWSY